MVFDPTNPIHVSAKLRGERKFQDAIDVIEKALPTIDPTVREIALLEAFKAAQEAGDAETAKAYARKIAVTEPDLPSIKGWV